MSGSVRAGGKPSKGTPKDGRLKDNKDTPKVKVSGSNGDKSAGAGKVTRGF